MESIFRQLILIVVIGMMAYGCATSAKTNAPKYKFAKEEFHLDTAYQGYSGSKLDTSTYYYRYDTAVTVFTEEGTYHILKFRKDGKVLSVSQKDLSRGITAPAQYHYYKIEKDSVLQMEFWRDKMAGMGYWTGIVYKDSIVFSKVNNNRQKWTYRKK